MKTSSSLTRRHFARRTLSALGLVIIGCRGDAADSRLRHRFLCCDYQGNKAAIVAADGSAVQRQAGTQVMNGQFIVVSENASSSQAFNWEVKAARADIAPLQVEE